MKKIFKEPLLYFLLLGSVLFALFQQVSLDRLSGTDQQEEILVTEGRIQALLLSFEKVWQRSPINYPQNSIENKFPACSRLAGGRAGDSM